MKRVISGILYILYIPLLLIGLLNFPAKIGFLLLLWPFLGPSLLHALTRIYGGTGSFWTTLDIWFESHAWWAALVFLIPLEALRPTSIMILLFLTGRTMLKELHAGHRMNRGVALSASILYGVFVYIFYTAEVQTSIFYTIIIAMVYLNRKKLTREAFVLLYRTQIGLKAMDSIARRYPRILKILGLFSIFFGFLGMLFISGYVLYNVFQLLFIPGSMPALTPLVPGVQIPGSQLSLPLIYGILSLFMVVVMHEFSHGVLSCVYKVPVKSSGLVLLGPLMGAFVEPDETHLSKQSAKVQLSVFGIGPFSNIVAALLVAFVIIPYILSPVTNVFFETTNITITSVRDGGPAEKAGITPSLLLAVEGKKIKDTGEFITILKGATPEKEISIQTDLGTFNVIPEIREKNPIIGVNLQEGVGIKAAYAMLGPLPWALRWIYTFMIWFTIISIGVGIANMLPVGPVDGGRMLRVGLGAIFTKNESDWIWKWIGMSLFLAILFILFFPLFKWILP